MPNWNNLPVEILAEILDLALKNDKTNTFKLQCMLISKQWSMVSRSIIYKSVTLCKSSQFEPFVTTMLNSSNGQLVKKVSLLYDDQNQLELNLGRLFKSCPNITSLKQPRYKKSSFFAKLLLEVLTGSGTKLRRIPTYDFTDPSNIRVYGYATYALKDTLECMRLYDHLTTKSTFEQNEALNQLQMYKNLKSIRFELKNHSNLFTVLEKIQYCHSLSSVRILADWDDHDVEKHLGIVEPLHLQSLSNVRYLQMSGMLTISSTLIQYVLRLFPNVKSFEYADNYNPDIFHGNRVQRLSAEEWERFNTQGIEIPNELWIQFLTYVASMRVCTIPHLFVKDIEVFSDVPNLYENLQILADDWLPQFDRDFKVYFGIFYNTTDEKNIRNMHQKENYKRHIVLNCDKKIRLVDCPKINAIKTLGPNLKALDFDAGSERDVDGNIENSVEANLFDLISDYCPHLDTLWVTDSTFHHKKQHTVKPIRSLERIQFRYCQFDEDYLCQLSSRLPSMLQFAIFLDCSVSGKDISCFAQNNVIDMPNTSFGSLMWKTETDSDVEQTVFIKLTKNKATSVFYKVSTNNQLAVSSSLEFETSKDNDMVETIDIRCFDIKMLAIKVPFLQSLLRIEEQAIICDDKSYMNLPDFSLFYANF